MLSRQALLDAAMKRAKSCGKPVLIYACRIEGRQMYRAPVVDDYMNLGLFSDPEFVEFVNRRFIPIRLYVTKDIGRKLGMLNADPKDPLFLKAVEPDAEVLKVLEVVLNRLPDHLCSGAVQAHRDLVEFNDEIVGQSCGDLTHEIALRFREAR